VQLLHRIGINDRFKQRVELKASLAKKKHIQSSRCPLAPPLQADPQACGREGAAQFVHDCFNGV